MANGIGDIDLPSGCENLFEVIDILQGSGLAPGKQKNVLWEWLKNNDCERFADIRLLLFGEMDEDEFCALYPEHPACQIPPEE